MRSFWMRVVVVAAVVVAAAGCGSQSSGVTAHRSETTTSASSTTSASNTTTSIPTTTTSAPTTTTSLAPIAAGWRDLPLDAIPSEAFPPCCASNWNGSPSPVLPETGDLPDGIYNAARVGWDPDTASLALDVRRYEACGLLPSTSCEPPPDGYQFQPGEMGVDGTVSRRLIVALDDNVRVVVVGWDNDAVPREASGADLAPVLVSLQHAYSDVIATPFNAGVDPDAIVNGLLATPAKGFGPPSVEMYGTLVFRSDGAPPLLFQYVVEYGDDRVLIDPTSVVRLTALQLDHGVTTLYFFAGYYP